MICIPIVAKNSDAAIEKIALANSLADMVEIRLDMMESFHLKEITGAASKPVIVTYRTKKEGGKGSTNYGVCLHHLEDAMEAGAEFVDVEYSMPLEFRHQLFQRERSSGLIISAHIMYGTPSRERLVERFGKMAATGADVVKIVTMAKTWEDNLRVLELIPRAQGLGIKVIAFCMGPKGRVSRILSLLMGGYLTFASLESGQESAAGQIPVTQMKKMLEYFSS